MGKRKGFRAGEVIDDPNIPRKKSDMKFRAGEVLGPMAKDENKLQEESKKRKD